MRQLRLPFRWTINPYRGCEFGCKYCYARYTHEFMELRDPGQFERKIFAKAFDAARFREELRALPVGETIALGTATDPYQPAERRYGVTRKMLEVFASMAGLHLGITTKSDLIVRDVELLKEVSRRHHLRVSMTVTTVDAELARLLEPMAPRPDLRLAAVRTLAEAGLRVVVGCACDAADQRQRVKPGRPGARSGGIGSVNILGERPVSEAVRVPGVPAVSRRSASHCCTQVSRTI